MNEKQQRDAELDWLARNLHNWPEPKIIPIGDQIFAGGAQFYEHWVTFTPIPTCRPVCFSKSQWQTRRAELQHKPSWEEAPEWAQVLRARLAGHH